MIPSAILFPISTHVHVDMHRLGTMLRFPGDIVLVLFRYEIEIQLNSPGLVCFHSVLFPTIYPKWDNHLLLYASLTIYTWHLHTHGICRHNVFIIYGKSVSF